MFSPVIKSLSQQLLDVASVTKQADAGLFDKLIIMIEEISAKHSFDKALVAKLVRDFWGVKDACFDNDDAIIQQKLMTVSLTMDSAIWLSMSLGLETLSDDEMTLFNKIFQQDRHIISLETLLGGLLESQNENLIQLFHNYRKFDASKEKLQALDTLAQHLLFQLMKMKKFDEVCQCYVSMISCIDKLNDQIVSDNYADNYQSLMSIDNKLYSEQAAVGGWSRFDLATNSPVELTVGNHVFQRCPTERRLTSEEKLLLEKVATWGDYVQKFRGSQARSVSDSLHKKLLIVLKQPLENYEMKRAIQLLFKEKVSKLVILHGRNCPLARECASLGAAFLAVLNVANCIDGM